MRVAKRATTGPCSWQAIPVPDVCSYPPVTARLRMAAAAIERVGPRGRFVAIHCFGAGVLSGFRAFTLIPGIECGVGHRSGFSVPFRNVEFSFLVWAVGCSGLVWVWNAWTTGRFL